MRKKGKTFNEIITKLGVAKGTLHYWLRDTEVSEKGKERILARKQNNLERIREIAARVNRERRLEAVRKAEEGVARDYDGAVFDKRTKELALAFLYLGEGFKRRNVVAVGNSSSAILRWFIELLDSIYGIDREKLKLFLYLRADQKEDQEKEYWANELSLSKSQFYKSQFDKRTIGKKTIVGYHGVCAIYYHNTEIERRLTAVQKYIANMRA